MTAHKPLTSRELDELLSRVNRGTMPVDVEDLVRDLRAARAALVLVMSELHEMTSDITLNEEDEENVRAALTAGRDALPPEDSND